MQPKDVFFSRGLCDSQMVKSMEYREAEFLTYMIFLALDILPEIHLLP